MKKEEISSIKLIASTSYAQIPSIHGRNALTEVQWPP